MMKDNEILVRTMYEMFHRSTIEKKNFAELAQVSEHGAISIKPINEVRW